MNILEKVEIKGFWGDKTIDVDFHTDVNFFIGVNGSGKTTVINLIAATLSADFPTLDKIEFSSITITLSEVGGPKKPIIEVVKLKPEFSPFETIQYRIKRKTSDKFKTFSLDEYEEEVLLRNGRQHFRHRLPMDNMHHANRGIVSVLKSLVDVSWLSINRVSLSDRRDDDDNYSSSVDQKLRQLSFLLTRYFSGLETKVSNEKSEFQKNIIVSLLTDQTESEVISSINKLDFEEEKKSLIDILGKLNIQAYSEVSRHYNQAKYALERFESPDPLSITQLMLLVSSYRSHKVVQEWNKLLEKQEEILKPKTTFISVLNDLFKNKSVEIDGRNEIIVTTRSGKEFTIWGLSSGEKQLLIILGEALLQDNSQWIYIADEPELSLHVSWQESLINNLLSLNPNLQILCATHSPDIVGTYSDRVFDMEKKVK